MTVLNTIKTDLLQARRDKNELVRNLLTALVGEVTAVGKNAGNRETTDEEAIALVKKFIKNAEDTRAILLRNNRDTSDVAAEISYLTRYIPAQMSEPELNLVLVRFKDSNAGANLGAAMKMLKDTYAGQYDGRLASQVAKHVFG